MILNVIFKSNLSLPVHTLTLCREPVSAHPAQATGRREQPSGGDVGVCECSQAAERYYSLAAKLAGKYS